MAKPMPMEPAVPDELAVEAIEELMPDHLGPAAFEGRAAGVAGLMAASIWTALVTISLLLSSVTVTGRFRAETMPVVAVSS